MVLEQRLERLEDLDFAGHSRRRLSLPLDHRHPQRALMSGHQALQVLEQQLRGEETQSRVRQQANRQTDITQSEETAVLLTVVKKGNMLFWTETGSVGMLAWFQ